MNALSVLFPALWWMHQSVLLFICNLLMLPLGLALLAWEERGGRFSPVRLLWLLPGAAMLLMNLRVNLTHPTQVLLPAALIAAALALYYALLCGKRRRWRRVAAVLIICLLTYGPGAAVSLNSLMPETRRVVMADPELIRPQWADVWLDGELQRFYARPDVTRTLSSAARCELRHCRGMLGIEYWVLMPNDSSGAI